MALRCPSARAADVKETLHTWLNTFKDVNLSYLCKTITADNGLEFSEISNFRKMKLCLFILLDLILLGNVDRTKGIMVYFVDVYRKECQ